MKSPVVSVEVQVRGNGCVEGCVEAAETPAAAQAGVPPAPGGEHEEEVPLLFIDLDEVYLQQGAPDGGAADILEAFVKEVLTFYGDLRYEIFLAFNPDIGDYIISSDFKKYEEEEEDLEKAAKMYALERGADMVVWLNDGYEGALALIWWEEGEE